MGAGRSGGDAFSLRPLVEALAADLQAPGPVDAPELAASLPGLRLLVPDGADTLSAGPAGSRLAVLEGIKRLLDHLGRDGGLLLVLEDPQWADAETMAVVEYLADHVRYAPVLCLCTERAEAGPASAELITVLTARRAAERLELAPLDEHDVEEMTRLTLGSEEVPAVVATMLWQRASGNPFAKRPSRPPQPPERGSPR